jgi:hypothetical protein
MASIYSVGDRVRFASEFISSTNQQAEPTAFYKGAVLAVKQFKGNNARQIVTVLWDKDTTEDHQPYAQHVLNTNLERIKANGKQ